MTCLVATCNKKSERRGWCSAHYARWKKHGDVRAAAPLRARGDVRAQLLSKITPEPGTGHWVWTGHVNKQTGYGMVNLGGRPTGAHRAVYEYLVGPIAEGSEPDHVCRVRRCVNVYDPEHIEVVTHAENQRRACEANRRDACDRGHAFTPENTYHRPGGGRTCRACKNAGGRAAYHRAKETAA